jgi:hypothetical protein
VWNGEDEDEAGKGREVSDSIGMTCGFMALRGSHVDRIRQMISMGGHMHLPSADMYVGLTGSLPSL